MSFQGRKYITNTSPNYFEDFRKAQNKQTLIMNAELISFKILIHGDSK